MKILNLIKLILQLIGLSVFSALTLLDVIAFSSSTHSVKTFLHHPYFRLPTTSPITSSSSVSPLLIHNSLSLSLPA